MNVFDMLKRELKNLTVCDRMAVVTVKIQTQKK